MILETCPLCGHDKFKPFLEAKDHMVSQESFQIVRCQSCQFTITNPRPDIDQLARYYESEEYISHSKTNRGFINKLYGIVKSFNLGIKYRGVKKYVPRGTWVDYGAGTGDFVRFIQAKGIEALGYEPNDKARREALSNNINLENPDTFHLIPDSTLACITLWHVLEHIPDLIPVLTKLISKLKPGGIIAIAVPNHGSYDAIHYKSHWAAYDVPRHLWHFREKDITSLAERFNLIHLSTQGMPFDSYYVSMLSEKYRHRNPIFGIFHGFLSNILARFSSYPFSSQFYILQKAK